MKAVCSAVMDNTGGAGTGFAYYHNPVGQPAARRGLLVPDHLRQREPEAGNRRYLHRRRGDQFAVYHQVALAPAAERRLVCGPPDPRDRRVAGSNPAAVPRSVLQPLVGGGSTAPRPSDGHITTLRKLSRRRLRNACAGPSTTITYDPAPALGLGRITATYTNEGEAKISGIDAQLDWGADIGPGTLSLNVSAATTCTTRSRKLAHNPLVNYVGTFGTRFARAADAASTAGAR